MIMKVGDLVRVVVDDIKEHGREPTVTEGLYPIEHVGKEGDYVVDGYWYTKDTNKFIGTESYAHIEPLTVEDLALYYIWKGWYS